MRNRKGRLYYPLDEYCSPVFMVFMRRCGGTQIIKQAPEKSKAKLRLNQGKTKSILSGTERKVILTGNGPNLGQNER